MLNDILVALQEEVLSDAARNVEGQAGVSFDRECRSISLQLCEHLFCGS